MEQSDWYTVGDVAKRAGVTPQMVRVWARAGKLEATRTAGGMRLFAKAAVEAFVAARVVARDR